MSGLLDRQLLFVSGKGGTGKTSVAAALAELAVREGKRTLVCEMDAKGALAAAFEVGELAFQPSEVRPGLFAMVMNTEDSLKEYLRLFVRIPLVGRIGPLARTFDFVADAAPGVKEILAIGKLCHEVRERHYDLVIVDAEASGHIVAQIDAPKAIRELVQVGMVRDQTDWMLEILGDARRTGLVVVATPEEMPVTETIELVDKVLETTDVDVAAIIANRVLPQWFSAADAKVFASLNHPGPQATLAAAVSPKVSTLFRAARAGAGPPRGRRRVPRPPPRRRADERAVDPVAGAVHPRRRTPCGRSTGRCAARRTGGDLMAVTPRRAIAELLSAKEMIVVCGSGGTGKSTVAAALGAQAAAVLGGRVLVLTVDPARRLATALGVGSFGNAAVQVAPKAFLASGVECRGELWVQMLDTKAGWDDLIRRHAPDANLRETVLANPLYRNITGRFVNSHDYLAMEQLYDLHASGKYDLVVIDTPPSRNGARPAGRARPDARVLRQPAAEVADRAVPLAAVHDGLEAVLPSRGPHPRLTLPAGHRRVLHPLPDDGGRVRQPRQGGRATAHRRRHRLRSGHDAGGRARREARFMAEELQRRHMPLGAMVLNRTLPAEVRQPAATKAAKSLVAAERDTKLMAVLAEETGATPEAVQHVLGEVAARFHDVAVVAGREAERRRELEAIVPLTATVPTMATDVHDLGGLLAIGQHLLGDGSR